MTSSPGDSCGAVSPSALCSFSRPWSKVPPELTTTTAPSGEFIGTRPGLALDNSCPTVRRERNAGINLSNLTRAAQWGLAEGGFDSVEDRVESHGEPLLRRRLSDDRRVGN